jgi:small multidrug resistance family-3 protein
MLKLLQNQNPLLLLVLATVLEVSGDALVRIALHEHAGAARIALWLAGAVLLAGYGTLLNLAPFEFGRVVGLYIATLFVVWQIINAAIFRTPPNLAIVVGGTLVVLGGLIITFWKPA